MFNEIRRQIEIFDLFDECQFQSKYRIDYEESLGFIFPSKRKKQKTLSYAERLAKGHVKKAVRPPKVASHACFHDGTLKADPSINYKTPCKRCGARSPYHRCPSK